jgi:hypothetical protein
VSVHYICPETGHLLSDGPGESPQPFCPDHGVELFTKCRVCGMAWDVMSEGPSYSAQSTNGRKICRFCSVPAPWLPRADLVVWVRNQVTSGDLSDAARVELVAVLDRLKGMDPSDERAVPEWKKLHELTPKIYNATTPVRDALMSEGVKRALSGLFDRFL